MSNLEVRNENLIEVLKRNGDFRKHYGPWLGALLLWLAMNSARQKPFWWGGLIGLATVAGGLVLKFGLPSIAG